MQLLSDTLTFIDNSFPMLLAIVASIWGIMYFRQLPPSLRALTLLVCFDAVMESIGLLLLYLKIPNLFLFPIVIVGEAGLMLLLYVWALQSGKLRHLAPWAFGFLVTYSLFDSILIPGTIRFRPSLQVMSDILSLSLGGLYFRKQLNELQIVRLEREPLFWISAGLVLTSLGNLLISLFSNYLLDNYSKQLNIYVWHIHTVLVGLLYGCYCVALWLATAQGRSAPTTASPLPRP